MGCEIFLALTQTAATIQSGGANDPSVLDFDNEPRKHQTPLPGLALHARGTVFSFRGCDGAHRWAGGGFRKGGEPDLKSPIV